MHIIAPEIEIINAIDGVKLCKKIEYCGKTCYKAEGNITDDSYIKFLKMIIKREHFSVLEHGSITVKFTTDRGITHEIVRHRIAAYSQESTRYCNYNNGKFGGEISLIPPKRMEKDPRFEKIMHMIESYYMVLIDEGVPAEDARDVLPTCLKSEIVATYNIREWRWFFEKRCSRDAHPKIRQIAKALLHAFYSMVPVLFDDLEEKFIQHGGEDSWQQVKISKSNY